MSTQEQVQIKEKQDVKSEESSQIVLWNDEVNTFDHVIESLVDICDHTYIQAEQCSLIVHYNGKCTVKTGDRSKLVPQCSALLDAGLSAELI